MEQAEIHLLHLLVMMLLTDGLNINLEIEVNQYLTGYVEENVLWEDIKTTTD